MKIINYAILLMIFCFSAYAQSSLAAKDVEAIKAVEETYRTAWLKNDSEKILGLFTDDATLYLGGIAPVRGKDGLQKFWFAPSETITTLTGFDVKIEDVSGSKNYAVATGSAEISWTTEKKDKSALRRFVAKEHFLAVYVKQNSEWKIWKRFGTNKTEGIK